MSLRPPRTIIAFGVAFVCALAVFTLPRFVWNTVQGAVRQQPTADTTHQAPPAIARSEEHTSELQSLAYLVCRLLLEKKKKNTENQTRLTHDALPDGESRDLAGTL